MLYGLKVIPKVGIPRYVVVQAVNKAGAEGMAQAVYENTPDAHEVEVIDAEVAVHHCGGIAKLEVIE